MKPRHSPLPRACAVALVPPARPVLAAAPRAGHVELTLPIVGSADRANARVTGGVILEYKFVSQQEIRRGGGEAALQIRRPAPIFGLGVHQKSTEGPGKADRGWRSRQQLGTPRG